ncbi:MULTISPECIES: DUF3710 domain-containing protein [Streptomycetaceae]|uniref:DUF3710 domain-containing protein n=1 Tax=Streptomycetaceae TaxID=2062 RepID=UPI00093BBB34|nr:MULTISPECIES: DUF3710 domain-containing protein [Streptomycetaceae]MDQ0310947.1 hypothetical protein [Kitasatospora herbaricolor]OKI23121.1 hypothetical protein A6A07_33045 [Streptomyces sp. CB03911]GGV27769.1 hypothetical protein GCM10010495_49790 [Kitasatospora herbaricolor]
MFRRRQKSEDAVEQLADDAISADEPADDVEGSADSESENNTELDPAERVGLPPAPRPDGPWDHSELEQPEEGRVDLGGLLVPGVEGMELRVEVAGDSIVAATLVLGNSAIQLQAFAAPKSEGIWGEVREEIANGITSQGGLVEEEEGPLGWHLRAQVPVQLPDGTQGVQLVRFVGCDGPRWFLRGVISGQAAVQPEMAGILEQVFQQTVVVRGDVPMAPRDPIVLKLPEDAQMVADGGAAPTEDGAGARFGSAALDPFARGPEITEVR